MIGGGGKLSLYIDPRTWRRCQTDPIILTAAAAVVVVIAFVATVIPATAARASIPHACCGQSSDVKLRTANSEFRTSELGVSSFGSAFGGCVLTHPYKRFS
jgi:hypothetical protein